MPAGSVPDGAQLPEPGPLLYTEDEFFTTVEHAPADVIVVQHWPRVARLAPLDRPLALDLHGPLMIESAFQRRSDVDVADMARIKLDAFRRADFVSCAGEHQRRYFLPWIMLAGLDVTTASVEVIPVSFPPDTPEHEPASGEVTFVYGGMFLPWQDPSVGLSALVSVIESEASGHLEFFGGPHPMFAMDIGVLASLEERLRDSDRVTVHGLRPRDELLETYERAHVALDLMRRNNERDLAFTTRTVEYLWCGLPVVYGDYGELAPYIREYDAGWAVPPDDEAVVTATLRDIVRNPDEVKRRSANAQRVVRERLNWERTIEPLDRFCQDPVQARRDSDGVLLVDRRTSDALGAELEAIKGSRSYRALEPLRRLYARLRTR
jgi:glycosyltransferase involved in cell wall biosynthesis